MLAALLAFGLQHQQDATVCDVLKRPSSHRGVVLKVQAEVLLAYPHGMMLLDEKCENTGIRLGFDLPNADTSAKDLFPSLVQDCSPGPKRYKVQGVFVGKLGYDAQGRVEFRLLSVPELQTKPCPKPGVPWTVIW